MCITCCNETGGGSSLLNIPMMPPTPSPFSHAADKPAQYQGAYIQQPGLKLHAFALGMAACTCQGVLGGRWMFEGRVI